MTEFRDDHGNGTLSLHASEAPKTLQVAGEWDLVRGVMFEVAQLWVGRCDRWCFGIRPGKRSGRVKLHFSTRSR